MEEQVQKRYINPETNEPLLEIRETSYHESIKKNEVIRKIAQATHLKQSVVEDVLKAFVDLFMIEVLTRGVFAFPGIPTVTRKVRGKVKRYQKDIDKTLIYPENVQLRARVPARIKKEHRRLYREQYNEMNGVTQEEWWKPYFYCDGDYRKIEHEEQSK